MYGDVPFPVLPYRQALRVLPCRRANYKHNDKRLKCLQHDEQRFCFRSICLFLRRSGIMQGIIRYALQQTKKKGKKRGFKFDSHLSRVDAIVFILSNFGHSSSENNDKPKPKDIRQRSKDMCHFSW